MRKQWEEGERHKGKAWTGSIWGTLGEKGRGASFMCAGSGQRKKESLVAGLCSLKPDIVLRLDHGVMAF